MKPDSEYIRNLLNVFQEYLEPTMDIQDIERAGIPYDDHEFYFHLRLLNDDGFVEREDGKPGIGVDRSADGMYQWSVLPLRLTSAGHTFAQALRSDTGFAAVKKSFVGASLSVMRDVAVAAFKGELTKYGFLPPG
jgi:hypothetical protein